MLKNTLHAIIVTVTAVSVIAVAQTPQPSDQLIYREAVVFLCDAYVDKLNESSLFQSTLPDYMSARRTGDTTDTRHLPKPIGLITFEGALDDVMDVLLENAKGQFIAAWPTTKIKSHRLLWPELILQQELAHTAPLAEKHWLSPLRQDENRLAITLRKKSDRFILYDVALPYKNPLTLKTEQDGTLRLLTKPGRQLHDLVLIRPQADQTWQIGIGIPPEVLETVEAGDVVEPTEPPEPAKTFGVGVSFDEPTDADAIIARFRESWIAQGLGESEAEVVGSIVRRYALDAKQMVAVWRMDDEELDKILPLELTPMADKIVRVGVVILINADPTLSQRIKELVKQLGDPAWSVRERAHRQLRTFGKGARPHLEEAVKGTDLEIVFRSEQLLSELDNPAVAAAVAKQTPLPLPPPPGDE